ncbi:hypothetical protein HOJ44_00505 [Candidatus Bathyarchaeota archaeon]|nr:hypothetical protein [Candidatus Bathyarchaeota archaeon]
MMVQQVCHEGKEVHGTTTNIESKIQELTRSVSEVYKYELLTTNQYLKQMELVLEIFNDLSETLAHQ